MNEKYYILYYPSSWGMGTNVDTRLVSDTDIRRLIRIELERKRRHDLKITEENDDRPDATYTNQSGTIDSEITVENTTTNTYRKVILTKKDSKDLHVLENAKYILLKMKSTYNESDFQIWYRNENRYQQG